MHVSYLYDLVLPSSYAAAIQILSTCRAMCDCGVSVDLYVRSITGPESTILRSYGLTPHPAFRLLPMPTVRRRVDVARLRTQLSTNADGQRHIVMSRGEPGIRLLPALRALPHAPQERHVYEAHRLCFTYGLVEKHPPPRGVRKILALLRSRRVRSREAATVTGVHGVVCLTPGVRAALADEFGLAGAPLILPSGTIVDELPLPADAERDIDIIYGGKLERRKGVDQLIEALRLLPDRRVWIIGGTPAEVSDVSAVATAAGVRDRVEFAGRLELKEARALYRRARVGVCPLPAGLSRISDEFTSPLKILDMMATGVPIVATDLATVRAMLTHEATALLVRANDPQALAEGIARLLEDRKLAGDLAARARSAVVDFAWEVRARRLVEYCGTL